MKEGNCKKDPFLRWNHQGQVCMVGEHGDNSSD
jgi:hypothetical protein